MMQYGRSDISDNELNDICKNIMKNEDEKKKIIDQLYDKKTLDHYKKSFTLKSKKISYDDFVKLASEKNKTDPADEDDTEELFGRRINNKNKRILYVPPGFAHGYLVMSNDSIVVYKCTNEYNPRDEYGIRWDDSDINIKWQIQDPIISKRDENLPLLKNQKLLPKY